MNPAPPVTKTLIALSGRLFSRFKVLNSYLKKNDFYTNLDLLRSLRVLQANVQLLIQRSEGCIFRINMLYKCFFNFVVLNHDY